MVSTLHLNRRVDCVRPAALQGSPARAPVVVRGPGRALAVRIRQATPDHALHISRRGWMVLAAQHRVVPTALRRRVVYVTRVHKRHRPKAVLSGYGTVTVAVHPQGILLHAGQTLALLLCVVQRTATHTRLSPAVTLHSVTQATWGLSPTLARIGPGPVRARTVAPAQVHVTPTS